MINNECYYMALNVVDRLEEIRQQKNISKYQIGKNLGHTGAYYQAFYDSCKTPKISTLIKLAKSIDVSIEYLLTGKNKDSFIEFNLNYELITNTKIKYLPNRLQVIKGRLKRQETNDFALKSLFEFEKYYNIPAIKLIGRE